MMLPPRLGQAKAITGPSAEAVNGAFAPKDARMMHRLRVAGNVIAKILVAMVSCGLLTLPIGCGPDAPQRFSESQSLMGTSFAITIYAGSEAAAMRAMDRAFDRIAEIEGIASTYDAESEVSQLNRSSSLSDAPDDLIEMVAISRRISHESDGAFDITVGALLSLWRFDRTASMQFWDLSPEEQAGPISAAMATVGMDHVFVDMGDARSIGLDTGTEVDFGGIAKGYAVDKAVEELQAEGIESGLVNAGGDVRAFGGKPDGSRWEIALRNPEDPQEYVARFKLSDGAVATSGNYERFFDPDAEVGHILDPRTGYSSQGASSATAFAPTCTEADALATAFFVLGPEAGIDLAEQLEGVEALIIPYDVPAELRRSSGVGGFEQE